MGIWIREAPTVVRRTATRVFIALLLVLLMPLAGCQKNSYQSCVDFQTEAATRNYKKQTPQPSWTLQEHIDNWVLTNCLGVK